MTCTIDGCSRVGKLVRKMCKMHYQRWRKASPEEIETRYKNAGKDCANDECTKAAFAKEYCRGCYKRFMMWGDPNIGKRIGEYSKKRFPNNNGYLQYYYPHSPHANSQGYVYEHREVMGEYIGRPLLKHETVHHKNGLRDDNRIENLELWSTCQPKGQRVKDKLAWAREMIDLYDGLFE